MQAKINEKRLLDTFLKLVRIDSESFHEGEVQRFVAAEMKKLGCQVYVDKAGKKIGSDAQGNIIATLKGNRPGRPFLFSAHMDTVQPGRGVKPQVKNGRITSDGTTVLGGDDKAGVAIMMEIAHVIKEQKLAHSGVQFVFTLDEESGMYGSKNLDYSKIKAKDGLILDNEPLEELLVRGPEVSDFFVEITGVAAHAGVCPEKGISALEVAAKALSMMKLGRIDAETVCNFGIVSGGQVVNAVMPKINLTGEARSLNPKKLQKQIKHMKDCFAKAAKAFTKKIDGKVARPVIDIQTPRRYGALNVPLSAAAVKLTLAAAKKYGVKMKAASSGGGCDANVFSSHGLVAPNLGLGIDNCHTPQESVNIKEFSLGAQIALEVLLNYK